MATTKPDDSVDVSREGDEPIPGYRLERLLGRGNFGEVWRVKAAGVHCALKIVKLGGEYPEVGDREVRSLQLVKRLAHTRICAIQGIWIKDWRGTSLDIDNIDKAAIKLGKYQNNEGTIILDRQQPPLLIVAMKLAQQSLYDLLKSYRASGRRGIPLAELMPYMRDSARGLDYLHDPKDIDGNPLDAVVHCDIKPQNILKHLDEALIGDLGIARRWDRVTGMTYKTEGVPNFLTPFYAAPELWSDRPVPATDQYALAVTFYQCLTDRLPFSLSRDELRDRTQIMMAHVGGRMRFRKHLEQVEGLSPGQVNRLIDALTQATLPDAGQRFPNATAFISAVEAALQPDTGSGSTAPATGVGGSSGGSGSGVPGENSPAGGSVGTVLPISTVSGSSRLVPAPAPQPAQLAAADAYAHTSAMPQIDTDKSVATVAHGAAGSGSQTSLAPAPNLVVPESPWPKMILRFVTVLALAGILAVAAVKLWPAPMANNGGPKPGPTPPSPGPTPPAPVSANDPLAFAAQINDIHVMIGNDRLANAGSALDDLKLPEADGDVAANIKHIVAARLATHRGQWDAAREALTAAASAAAQPQENDPLAATAQSHRALAEMLDVLVGARWPVGDFGGQKPAVDAALAAQVAAVLNVPDAQPLTAAAGWGADYTAVKDLASQVVQMQIDELWTGTSPDESAFAALNQLLTPSPSQPPAWKPALRAEIAQTVAPQFGPLEALVMLSGTPSPERTASLDKIIRELAEGGRRPAQGERIERLVVLIPDVVEFVKLQDQDPLQVDLALKALNSLTDGLASPTASVQQALGRLISDRLWLAINLAPRDKRQELFDRCEMEHWASKLDAGGAPLALLETFAAECLSQKFDDAAADVQAATNRLNRGAMPADAAPELADYRAYVEAVVRSYAGPDKVVVAGSALAALFPAEKALVAPLQSPERQARAAARLVRCGQRVAGLESRDAVEINHKLDDLSWSLPAEKTAGQLAAWMPVAARLSAAEGAPTAAAGQLDDRLMRELLLALAMATAPETLGQAADMAQALVEQGGLKNTQLLKIRADAAVAAFKAAAGKKSGP